MNAEKKALKRLQSSASRMAALKAIGDHQEYLINHGADFRMAVKLLDTCDKLAVQLCRHVALIGEYQQARNSESDKPINRNPELVHAQCPHCTEVLNSKQECRAHGFVKHPHLYCRNCGHRSDVSAVECEYCTNSFLKN